MKNSKTVLLAALLAFAACQSNSARDEAKKQHAGTEQTATSAPATKLAPQATASIELRVLGMS